MNTLLKHLLIIGFVLPTSLAGYHVVAGSGTSGGGFTPESIRQQISEFSLRSDYDLGRLELLERDLYRVEHRYVERERFDTSDMFDGAIERVQRQYPEVLFHRPEGSQNLHVAVGTYSTVLRISPILGFDELYQELMRVARILDDHLDPETKRREVEYALINGVLSTLDPHTILLPPAAARDMEVDNQGEFGGLGIEISTVEGQLMVKVPLEDTPAFRAGLKPDDHIVRIDGESTINIDLDDAVSKLRGKVGEPVTIAVMRKGFNSPKNFKIVRERIRINALEGELLDGDVGYIRIKSFNAKAARDLEDSLSRFHREASGSLKGLVLDLRTNPGGFLNQAIDVADKFLAEGVIVATEEGATGDRAEQRASRAGTEPDYPIAVLVNSSSASASEIVAGAIRNQGRGVVIGERTFGKGSIQHLYPHKDDESRLKLTIGKYLTPGDRSIQAVGVTPDIRLIPSLVEPPEELEEPDPWDLELLPHISLYWREWMSREDSLDRSFKRVGAEVEKPSFQVRYHFETDEEDIGRRADPRKDWEVQFARDVVLAAPSSRRADMLRASARVVRKYGQEQGEQLQAAFSEVGLDWTSGENPEDSKLSVVIDLGEDGSLSAGDHENVGMTVTNNGDQPVYRISAVTKSENPWLDQREFYFGLIPAGESRTYRQRIALHHGYPSESVSVDIVLQDPDHDAIVEEQVRVRTQGRQLPALSYAMELYDGREGRGKGNGDGTPNVGETVQLAVVVTNNGAGPTRDAFVRLKNRSGRSLDLLEGGFAVGDWINLKGESCKEESVGCWLALAPGQSFEGVLEFTLAEPTEENGSWDVDLSVGDNRAYDYSVIRQGGFYDYFQLEESITISAGSKLSDSVRTPPTIDVTRKPDLVTTSGFAVVSGVAVSNQRIREVMIYHGEDKIFYQGGGEKGVALPFTVEKQLEPGPHHFYILVRDEDGLASTASVHVWQEDSSG
jgi:carboxyl-terminal processing protease